MLEEEHDDGPGVTFCLECNTEIPDDDTGNTPYCSRCWIMLQESGYFDLTEDDYLE
jgi:hypothetical protein